MSKFPVSFSLYITGTLLKGGEGGRTFPKLSHLGGRLRGVDVEIGGCFFLLLYRSITFTLCGGERKVPFVTFQILNLLS